jgi:RimJ/RimL family protein N-acetyltransferase
VENIVSKDVVVEPMTEEVILWRCLHTGPLSRSTIGQWTAAGRISWERYRERNVPLLLKLTRTYGACAMMARDDDRIVGLLRFYPKVVWNMEGAGGLCLQQDFPSGPADGFSDIDFPALAQIEDKTLLVHCLMTGSPQWKENAYQRRGIGTRLVETLIRWARTNGWDRVEAQSFEDIPIIYEITGNAGHTFWEKLGFSIVDRHPHPDLLERSQFVLTLEEQARSAGISPERARDRLVMQLTLTCAG